MLTWQQMDESFADYVRGKSIAIVGPAATAIGREQGHIIESCGLVARVKSFMYPDEMKIDLGSRTDILYTTEARDRVDIQEYKEYNHPVTGNKTYKYEKFSGYDQYNDIEFVVSTYPQDEWFADRFVPQLEDLRRSDVVKCRFVNSEHYFKAKAQTNRPNSGFSAIVDMLSFDIDSLHIFGLDFHRSMYRKSYQNSLYTHETIKGDTLSQWSDQGDSHQPDLQYQYFKHNVWGKDTRVKPDQALLDFLNDDSYDSIY